jgi:hypothetical protein
LVAFLPHPETIELLRAPKHRHPSPRPRSSDQPQLLAKSGRDSHFARPAGVPANAFFSVQTDPNNACVASS